MKKQIKWAVGSMLAASLVAAVGSGPAVAAPSASAPITEYYNGKIFTLTPENWHGAKDCAIDSATVAHCSDTDDQFAAYTNSTSTVTSQGLS